MKSPLLAFAVVVLVAILTLGCATVQPYTGPAGNVPIVGIQEWTHWNTTFDPRHPFWERHRYVMFANPTTQPVSFVVDCDNNYVNVDVPARSTNRLMVTREDGACDIRRQ